MQTTKDRIRSLIAQEAADWYVANCDGLDEAARRAFTAWLRTSPVHMEEYLAVASVGHTLPDTAQIGEESIDALVALGRQAVGRLAPREIHAVDGRGLWLRERAWQWALASILTVGVALGLLWPRLLQLVPSTPAVAVQTLTIHSGHGQPVTHVLEDRSQVELDSDTDVALEFTPKARTARLVKGRAHFKVAHEASRAFVVIAGSARVRAIGTDFDVLLDGAATVVTLYDGRLLVDGPESPGAGAVALEAGQSLRIDPARWPAAPFATDARRSSAWQHRQLIVQHQKLEQVAAEFNRYLTRPIHILTPRLRTLEISGIFRTDDVDAFLTFLRSLEGVHVEVTGTEIRVE